MKSCDFQNVKCGCAKWLESICFFYYKNNTNIVNEEIKVLHIGYTCAKHEVLLSYAIAINLPHIIPLIGLLLSTGYLHICNTRHVLVFFLFVLFHLGTQNWLVVVCQVFHTPVYNIT